MNNTGHFFLPIYHPQSIWPKLPWATWVKIKTKLLYEIKILPALKIFSSYSLSDKSLQKIRIKTVSTSLNYWLKSLRSSGLICFSIWGVTTWWGHDMTWTVKPALSISPVQRNYSIPPWLYWSSFDWRSFSMSFAFRVKKTTLDIMVDRKERPPLPH